jgi:hypothetical protein
VSAVEWHVGGRDHRRNIDLAFKKPDLRTLIKSATHTGKKTANEEENETSTVE